MDIVVDPLVAFFANKPKIWLLCDPEIQNAFKVYGPSFQTEDFLSEEGRNIYGEACKKEKFEVERLQYLCIESLANNFKGGRLDERLKHDNLVFLGEKLDVEHKLEELIELECDPFWKRVVEAKVCYPLDFFELSKLETVDWKQEGIQLKFAEIIQEMAPEDWELDEFMQLSSKVFKFIQKLEIRHLKCLKKPEHRYMEEKLDYPSIEECHHGSLEFFKTLIHLNTLCIQLCPKELFRSYKREAYECSYADIENLAKGIKNLPLLKCLKITNSRLDSIKTDVLFTSLQSSVQLSHIDFSNCCLTGDSAVSLGIFIAKSTVLKHIELQGNLLDEQGVRCIAFGLQKTSSKNIYLGLSRNPIGNSGIIELGAGLCKGKNVTELDISGIDIDHEGIYRVAHIVQLTPSIKKLNISCIIFTENAGDALVNAMRDNQSIVQLECRSCGLTEKQEFDLRCLAKGNKFYKENPCMFNETFAKEDEQEIDAWFKRVKQPLLVEAEKLRTQPKFVPSPVKSDPIPEELRRKVKKSTAELLGLSSLVETCTVDPFISRKPPRSIIKPQDPKDFEDLERSSLASKFRTLCSSDFNAPHYF